MATQRKVYTKKQEDEDSEGLYQQRQSAQKVTYAKLEELLERDVTRVPSKSYTQYTRELLAQYTASPLNNIDSIRDISQYLTRVSMIYQKILLYYSTMPLYTYNITPLVNYSGDFDSEKYMRDYEKVLKQFNNFNMFKEMSNAVYQVFRDGMYVGFMYNSEEDGMFLMPLDPQYCRIYGKGVEGEWIVYFDAAYFDRANNVDFVKGINNDGIGVWDQCFVDGYNNYKNNGRDYEWFRLTPELTFCMIAGSDDEFYLPLPYFLPLFKSLLQLLDTEDLVADKNELENYKLILNKIPLLGDSNNVDDFAVSLDLVMKFQKLLEQVVPDQVGIGITPCDTDVIEFEKSTSTADTDEVNQALNNLFNNAGLNKLVISSGSSSNSNGLKYSIANDLGNMDVYIKRIESWLNYYIKHNIAEGFHLELFTETQYNRADFIQEKKEAATLGGSKTDYLCSLGDTPYEVYSKLKFETLALDISQYMTPLESTYTMSSDSGGRPEMDEDDLSDEGASTRASGKNED